MPRSLRLSLLRRPSRKPSLRRSPPRVRTIPSLSSRRLSRPRRPRSRTGRYVATQKPQFVFTILTIIKDKCLRTVADFRNLQERTTREVKSAKDFAIQKFAKDLVDSVDNLDRALGMVPQDKLNAKDRPEGLEDLANLYEGLKMTEDILMNTLKKHGLERLNPEGEKFNPNEQEATFMTPQPDKEDGTVFFVQQKGFKLNGRVLRAAKVGVVKNK
jgi:molecular chaperone GrpE (heat shock protein)